MKHDEDRDLVLGKARALRAETADALKKAADDFSADPLNPASLAEEAARLIDLALRLGEMAKLATQVRDLAVLLDAGSRDDGGVATMADSLRKKMS